MAENRTDISLDGIATRVNGRHAFVHERVLEIIVNETAERGAVTFRKADLARRLGCCNRSVDRAVSRLRRDGLVVSEPLFDANGAQLGNRYRATDDGNKLVGRMKSRASALLNHQLDNR